MSRCRFKSSRFSPARMSAADPKFVEEIIAWNEVEELFRKYDKDRTGTLSCDEVADALKDLGVIVTSEDISDFMTESEEWDKSKVTLLKFEYLFERFRASNDPFAVDENNAMRGTARGRLAAVVRATDRQKEKGRASRRTVFVDTDWKKFRSSYRIIDNLASFYGKASVLRAIWLEVSMVASVSASVWILNSFVLGGPVEEMLPESFKWNLEPFTLPTFPFFICSNALGLLLVFRTDWAYTRYRSAILLWGEVADCCKRLFSQTLVTFQDPDVVDEIFRRTIAFSLVLKKHVRAGKQEEDYLVRELRLLLGEEQALRLLTAKHRPYAALHGLVALLASKRDEANTIEMEKEVLQMMEKVGWMERIYRGPVPLVYTRFTGRYLALWMLLMPFALYKELNGSLAMLPAACIIAVFFFGIDELGTQIEEPFSLLPLEWLCDGIESTGAELLEGTRDGFFPCDLGIGDNVRPLKGNDDY